MFSGLSANWQHTLDTTIPQAKALEAGTFLHGLPKVKTVAWFLGDELIERYAHKGCPSSI
jgi:hypothetical protein